MVTLLARGARTTRANKALALPILLGTAALGLLLATLFADRHLAHGVRARFLTRDDVVIATTLEHRTTFPNGRRFTSRVVEGWDRTRAPTPADPLWFVVEITGVLDVPEGAPRTLTTNIVATTPPIAISIDGHTSERLTPGRHRVRIRFSARTNGIQGLELFWNDASSEPTTIPSTAWHVPGGAPMLPRVALWAFALLAFASVGHAFRRAFVGPRDTALLSLIAIVAIGMLGLGLRAYDYDVVPGWDENNDEMYTAWDGIELLASGTTRGWSLFETHYPARVSRERFGHFGRPYTVISPAFEHPPLMHLLAGITERAFGTTRYQDARLSHARIPSILLYIPTVILLFLLARRLVPEGCAAHIACLVHAVQPTIALSSRTAKEEVLLTPIVLGAVLLFTRYETTKRTRDAFFVGLVVGIGILAKLPAAFFAVALVVLVFRFGGLRPALFTSIGVAIGIGVLLLFAACVDWEVFWAATRVQSSIRATHWNLFPRYFTDAFINRIEIGQGHLLFLWIAYFVAIRGPDGSIDLRGVVPPLTYLGMLAVTAGEFNYGWYLLPVYPFLCIYAGRFIRDAILKPNLAHGLVMIGLLLMYSCNYVVDAGYGRSEAGWAVTRRLVPTTFYGLFVPLLIATALPRPLTKSIARTSMALCLAGFVLFSTYTIIAFERIRDTHGSFDGYLIAPS